MATFNQQGQHVQNQYNAENIHIGNIHNSNDLITQLQQFTALVNKAVADGSIERNTGMAVINELESVTVQAGKPDVKKTTLVQHLTKAQEILKGVTAAGGLVEGLKQLIKAIANLFL